MLEHRQIVVSENVADFDFLRMFKDSLCLETLTDLDGKGAKKKRTDVSYQLL